MHEFLIDLARDGKVLQASDQFLNPADRLLDPADPVADPTRSGSAGAWLDGWETRRVRPPGHEWVIVKLGRAGTLRQLVIDTTHVTTSLPSACSVEAIDLPGDPSLVDLVRNRGLWHEVVPQRSLRGSGRHHFEVPPTTATHLRMVIYPDGAIARLRAMGEPLPADDLADRGEIDLISLDLGGLVVAASDARTSSPNLMLQGPSKGGRDGWMTRRRREPGNEWAIVRLAGRGQIDRIEIDTRSFEGDAPERVAVMGIDLPTGSATDPADDGWFTILPETPIASGVNARFTEPEAAGPVTHVRLDLHPDGALTRFRAFGRVVSADADA